MGKIKAVLFDSGRVLNGPVSGHWFITPNFYNYIDKKVIYSLPDERVNLAFEKAAKYIIEQKLIVSEEEEYVHFYEYYKIFFSHLPELNATEQTIEQVARDLVFNYDKYVFFKDAVDAIQSLNGKYIMGIVSDAWPSLENVFKKAGFRDYFSSFVISSKLGISKPHEQMYRTALDEIKVSPDEAIFIDDSIKNCDGAKDLGIKTLLLCRDFRQYVHHKLTCTDHSVIRSLKEVKHYL